MFSCSFSVPPIIYRGCPRFCSSWMQCELVRCALIIAPMTMHTESWFLHVGLYLLPNTPGLVIDGSHCHSLYTIINRHIYNYMTFLFEASFSVLRTSSIAESFVSHYFPPSHHLWWNRSGIHDLVATTQTRCLAFLSVLLYFIFEPVFTIE